MVLGTNLEPQFSVIMKNREGDRLSLNTVYLSFSSFSLRPLRPLRFVKEIDPLAAEKREKIKEV